MRERSQISDPVTDQLEEAWWNQNAEVIEAIWAQPYAIRVAVRSHYMMQAKQFFLNGSDRPIRVLEVGCGSGWVGRMIAEPGEIEILGIDLSEQQINLARQNVASEGLDSVCEYYCQNLANFVVNENPRVSCVIIHAILHHLSWQEIHIILSQIASLGAGTKIFVYEPVYLNRESSRSGIAAQVLYPWSGILSRIPRILSKILVQGQSKHLDCMLQEKVQTLCKESTEKGWVLSPKEIVFQEEELLTALSQYCLVNKRYLCNHTSIGACQPAVFYNSDRLHTLLSKTVLPLSIWIDHHLFKTNMIARVTNEYVFMGYECIVK
jgi:SAM-dependent methyltransferase